MMNPLESNQSFSCSSFVLSEEFIAQKVQNLERAKQGLDEENPVLKPYSFYQPVKGRSLFARGFPESYRFPSTSYPSVLDRLKSDPSSISSMRIDNKVLFVIQNYFLEEEKNEMRAFADAQRFPIWTYNDPKGKKSAARSVDLETTQQLMSSPPQPLSQLYKFISTLSAHLNVEITMFPTRVLAERGDKLYLIANGINTNGVNQVSFEEELEGSHKDYQTNKWMAFKIPLLYPEEKIKELKEKIKLIKEQMDCADEAQMAHIFHPEVNKKVNRTALKSRLFSYQNSLEKAEGEVIDLEKADQKTYHPTLFFNGDSGRPLIMTLMLYTTTADFKPQYGLGTSFFSEAEERNGSFSNCEHMRVILFRGDISHSIAASKMMNINASRVSWVFKLVMNPTKSTQNIQNDLEMFFSRI